MKIRSEVQVTPTIDLFGNKTYYWAVYQEYDGVRVNLEGGFSTSVYRAHIDALRASEEYAK